MSLCSPIKPPFWEYTSGMHPHSRRSSNNPGRLIFLRLGSEKTVVSTWWTATAQQPPTQSSSISAQLSSNYWIGLYHFSTAPISIHVISFIHLYPTMSPPSPLYYCHFIFQSPRRLAKHYCGLVYDAEVRVDILWNSRTAYACHATFVHYPVQRLVTLHSFQPNRGIDSIRTLLVPTHQASRFFRGTIHKVHLRNGSTRFALPYMRY